MQVRLQGETARLASLFAIWGTQPRRSPAVTAAFGDELVGLDEVSQLVAAAVFPSAVQGLREANVKLWDFEKIQWKRYTDILNDVVQRGAIPSDQQVRIQAIADDVARAFNEVNVLLNDLAESPSNEGGRSAENDCSRRPIRLRSALQAASDKLDQSHSGTLAAFGPVIKASAKIAEDVAKRLQKLTIPVFPAYEGLGRCCDVVTQSLYERLSGVQPSRS
jgi:hypothetical protein